ncbi:acyltransferase [Porphyromonas circumdentaria]|uniref:UDP-2-acetamido-3-amino-2,3-dideoxy-glucuronate N-acetyltransferase n=1 Tax=Porphyromonas circumdentaria TaxID=29524 RepID=A0A1T4P0S5_9PORP|nr:acyltransferase [Porphyromonas circumdentaria]MBB6276260.1 UDP-2-acetamido-3-amino-2,3-dideoxy-glucuronate N-acetyltransferase [Porphyromonas circumdentaria]SJZ85039.1 UDP-2-acetamido-3-amino-2,3-dideoxy-glucuronate N-acetyltransferase [Porphyromonas circumdentaria]
MDFYIHPTSIVDPAASIGRGSKIWHFCHIMGGCTLGECCVIGQNVFIAPQVRLGNGCKVQNNVSLYTGVVCEDDVFIGPSVVFTNVINPRAFIERKEEFRPTLVQKGASIGANATIICGHSIGRYALVGGGSVVCQDVPNYALVVGNPARQIGWVSRAGMQLDFSSTGEAICPVSGESYTLIDGSVKLNEK